MNCAGCHDGSIRGILNLPMGKHDSNLVQTFVEGGRMPPQSTELRPNEREALARCLVQEYAGGLSGSQQPDGVLSSYFRGPRCPSESGVAPPVSGTVAPRRLVPPPVDDSLPGAPGAIRSE
jgi:hypothetical protein